MSTPDLAHLTEYRELRDAAWAVVHDDINTLRADLDATGIGERIKDRATEEAHDAWDGARDVAAEHKGVIAGTILALMAWLLRGPIGDAFSALFGSDEEQDAEQPAGENVEQA